MFYEHSGHTDSNLDGHTSSSPAAVHLGIIPLAHRGELMESRAAARSAAARTEVARLMRKTIAVPLEAVCSREEVPQLELTATGA